MKAPGIGFVRFVRGVRSRGFLDFVGALWREHGDVFQVRIGPRTPMLAIHPDAVEHVNLSHQQRAETRRRPAPW